MPPDEAVVARGEVRTGESLDALFVAAEGGRRDAFYRSLRDALGPFSRETMRTPSGLRVPADVCLQLEAIDRRIDLRWTSAARRYLENRRNVGRDHDMVYGQIQDIKARGATDARALIQDSEGLDVLDDHQAVNVAAMTVARSPGLCVFDEQGAGKTVTLIYAFDLLVERNEADRVVIVAPKSMVGEWPKDIERFRNGLYRTALLTGSPKQKRRLLTEGPDVIVTNFETAVSIEEELCALMRAQPGRTVLAVDESFYVKSMDAKRTRALRRLREWAGRAFVLCGTPAPNAPIDLVEQFNLVDFGYCFDRVDVPDDRDSARDVVRAAIEAKGLYVRHLKADVLPDLPPKRFQRVTVPMEVDQARLYRDTLSGLAADVEATDEETFARGRINFLARRSRLLQLCSHPGSVEPGYAATPAKFAAIDALLERVVAREGEKVVLWSFYTASITALVERYEKYGAVRYDGAVSDVEARREAVRQFQEDDETMVFVANPAAAGAGLTLHRARIAVYESFSNQAAHYLQSLDRIHRRGQSRDVEYVVVLCEGTVEVIEYDRLIAKERAAQDLLGDTPPTATTRESFLADVRDAGRLLDDAIGVV